MSKKKNTPTITPIKIEPTAAELTATHASALAQIKAALGVPEFTDVQGIVEQIGKLRAIQVTDPVFQEMYEEKLRAGLPPKIAKIATENQIRHDAKLAAEKAQTAQTEAAEVRTLRAVDQFSARYRKA